MNKKYFSAMDIAVRPISLAFYVPPIVWKGDPVGHIGTNDVFFLLLKGSIVLFIDNDFYIVRAGQLAFLPKGKMRRYTCITKEAELYTMSFSAQAEDVNLMQGLGLTEHHHVVTLENPDEVKKLFEDSAHVEMNKDPIYNVIWAENILNLIRRFSVAGRKQHSAENTDFDRVIAYMKSSLNENLTLETLSDMVYMQPTYFCRCFKKNYGVSPIAYFTSLRIFRAMELLLKGDVSNEGVAEALGIKDVSYFSRWFKKNCGLSPGEYRMLFEKRNVLSVE